MSNGLDVEPAQTETNNMSTHLETKNPPSDLDDGPFTLASLVATLESVNDLARSRSNLWVA